MTDSLERRDWFVNAAARKCVAAGVSVPVEALQRQAAADLQLLDQARASGALRDIVKPKTKTSQEVLDHKRSLKAEAQAEKVGGTMRRRKLPVRDPISRGPRLSALDRERTAKMTLRLRAIGARAGSIRTGQDLETGFQYPALARAAAEQVTNHGYQRGEYAGKSARDRDRILFRRLQDICDRSDAVFGVPWWVK